MVHSGHSDRPLKLQERLTVNHFLPQSLKAKAKFKLHCLRCMDLISASPVTYIEASDDES